MTVTVMGRRAQETGAERVHRCSGGADEVRVFARGQIVAVRWGSVMTPIRGKPGVRAPR